MTRFPLLLVVLVLVCCRCKSVPPVPPPEPTHVVTIGDASFSGDTCTVAFDVLDALSCDESMHDKAKFIVMCSTVGSDFDFGCVAACHDTDCVHACHVRCQASP